MSTTERLEKILEPHYTIQEIAQRLRMTDDSVRRLFEREKGVVEVGSDNPRHGKRRYVTLRIPESVLRRKIAELQR